MTLCAGTLNRQIEILSLDATKNDFGEPIFQFATQANGGVWANVKPLTGTENFIADQAMSETQFIFTMHYTTLITPDPSMRVQYNSQEYNIKVVINVNDENIQYDLFCNRVAT